MCSSFFECFPVLTTLVYLFLIFCAVICVVGWRFNHFEHKRLIEVESFEKSRKILEADRAHALACQEAQRKSLEGERAHAISSSKVLIEAHRWKLPLPIDAKNAPIVKEEVLSDVVHPTQDIASPEAFEMDKPLVLVRRLESNVRIEALFYQDAQFAITQVVAFGEIIPIDSFVSATTQDEVFDLLDQPIKEDVAEAIEVFRAMAIANSCVKAA